MKQKDLSSPPGCTFRKATSGDKASIRWLVFSAILDPTQLHWQQFWVIEFAGKIIACGQLRQFSEAQELGSLVVAPIWRGQGLATLLTQHLITQATQPLYLECLGERLKQFYRHFGFVQITFEELPRSLQQKFRLSHLAQKLMRVPVVFMQYQGEEVTNLNAEARLK
ncbi:acetyltransferase, N-acetylglutamate synthase [Nostoc sp. PCC 7524]|uniref:GNAT family N-acetyltransferase n=1 Tax=Nostoc sp. (strain ATCC 29411 / PCC 7524) TaxID=28072 RepID=UPI00029EF154|nr:GNAT family N-acetyltransferase [Nostoc sp. PCC 7524]AFY46588.1 acetyltransferase, N-acetylglutamate synthase [Nostoc sp. PCC 7524]